MTKNHQNKPNSQKEGKIHRKYTKLTLNLGKLPKRKIYNIFN